MSHSGRVEWFHVAPFFLLHAAFLLVLVVGWIWTALAMAIVVCFSRVFGLAPCYHRHVDYLPVSVLEPTVLASSERS